MKKTIIFFASLLLMAVGAQAQQVNKLYAGNVNCMKNTLIDLPIYLDNTSPNVVAVQFEVSLPEDVSISNSNSVKFDYNRVNDHQCRLVSLGKESNHERYRIMVISPTNKPFRANKGKLFTLSTAITADANLELGETYPVTISHVVIGDSLGYNVMTGYDNGSLTLKPSPDFIATSPSITSGDVTPGGTVSLSWIVNNIGTQDSQGGWSEQISFISDATGETMQLTTMHYTSPVSAGEGVLRTATVAVPKVTGISGAFKIQVKIVPNSDSGEDVASQGNNTTLSTESFQMNQLLYFTLPQETLLETNGERNYTCLLERSGSKQAAQTFTLQHSAEDSRITMPTSVTIPAGSQSTYFNLTVNGDNIIGAEDFVTLTYTIPAQNDYPSVEQQVTIEDDDYPTLTIKAVNIANPGSNVFNEGDMVQLEITSSTTPKGVVTVNLTSDKGERLSTLPASVTLDPTHAQTNVGFYVTQDNIIHFEDVATITASATRYNQGQCQIVLTDDDMPTLTMTTSSDWAKESAGYKAVLVTIERSGNMTPEVTLRLDQHNPDGSSCNTLYFPKRTVTLKKNKTKAEFYLGVNDDNESQGSRDVVMTAAVYSKSCDCQAGQGSVGLLEQTINIIDNEGPSYTLTPANTNIREGEEITFTITVNTTRHTQDIPITVGSNKPSEVTLPAAGTVILPAGVKTTTFQAGVKQNSVQGDSHRIKFYVHTVEGNEYAATWGRGECIIMATDQTLPDATVPSLRILTPNVSVDDSIYVETTIANCGYETLPAGTPIQFRHGTHKFDRYIERDVLAGQSITQRDTLPTMSVAGKYQLVAEVDVPRTVSEVDKANNQSDPIELEVKPLFTATNVTTDKRVYLNNETVTITGRAAGLHPKNTAVEVYVFKGSKRYVVKGKTDVNGDFSVVWTPKGNVAGHFIVGACTPDEDLKTEMTSFEMYGMRRSDEGFLLKEMEVGETLSNCYFEVKNHGTLTLNNITATIPDASASGNVTITTTPIQKLSPGQMAPLFFTIKGLAKSEGEDWQTVTLHLQSSEGAVYDQTLYFYVHSSVPSLKANMNSINATMTPGKVTDFPITLRNEGRAETGEMVLDLGNIDWLRASTPVRMPSLKQYEEATVVLQFAPPSDMQLNSLSTGQLAINCPETNTGLMIPFRVEAVSEETGTLVIDVWDEFTLNNNANDGPHVEGATVNVLHPVTRQLLRQAVTGSDGLATFEQLNAGNYIVAVTHPRHSSWQNDAMVNAGRSEKYRAVISYSAITVEMRYEPTEIEDEYDIVTNVTYETNVPAPVVTMDMPDKIILEEIETPYLFYVNLTNVGLVAAEKTTLSLPHTANGYTFTPLIEGPWTILPQQTVTIPVEIDKQEDGEQGNARAASPLLIGTPSGPYRIGAATACGVGALAQFVHNCGSSGSTGAIQHQVEHMMQIAEACNGVGTTGDYVPWLTSPSNPGGPGGGGTNTTHTGQTDSSTSGGGSGVAVVSCNEELAEHADDYFLDLLGKKFPSVDWVKTAIDALDDRWEDVFDDILGKLKGKIWDKLEDKYLNDFKYKDLYDWVKGCLDFKSDVEDAIGARQAADVFNEEEEEDSTGVGMASGPNKIMVMGGGSYISYTFPHIQDADGTYSFDKYMEKLGNKFRSLWKDLERGRQRVAGLNSELDEAIYLNDRHHTKEKPTDIGSTEHPDWYPSALRVWDDNRVAPIYHYYHSIALLHEIYGDWSFMLLPKKSLNMLADSLQTFIDNPEKEFLEFGVDQYTQAASGLSQFNFGDANRLDFYFKRGYPYPALNILKRWRNTVLQMRGQELTDDVDNYIHQDIVEACLSRLKKSQQMINRAGYDDESQMLIAENKKLFEYLSQPRSSICSSVKLQLEQKLTMTRQAVRGILTVNNGSDTQAMTNVKLKLTVTDPDGNVADSHIMEITTENIVGFTGENNFESGWTLGAGTKGEARILFIPTRYAAPDAPVQYTFAGTISFTDPFTGTTMTRDLEIERLTVKPSPVLDLTYLMQRDILGDDALTTDIIEPTVPSQFTLLINNKGKGDATKVRMVTQQPEIMENEKGLLVDFEVESSQLNGGDKTLAMGQSVATDFGTIPAGKSSVAQWWLTSKFTGHFTSYDVAATHVSSYDNPDLSLLDEVTIHELIHQIELPGVENTSDGSTAPDNYAFLVNDEEDYHDYPDQLYTVDGGKQPVREVARAAWTKIDDTQYRLHIVPKSQGWSYGNIPDPTGGQQLIKKVTRIGDSSIVLPAANFWQTDRTLVDGQEPLYENLIHYADDMLTTGMDYIVDFEPKPAVRLDVTEISGVPNANAYTREAVGEVTVTFNMPIDESTLDASSFTLMHQGENVSTSGLTIVKINDTTFKTDLTTLTTFKDANNEVHPLDGYFLLTVNTANIRDLDGFYGQKNKSTGWTQTEDGKAMLTMVIEPEGAGTVTPGTSKHDFFGEVALTATPTANYTFAGWKVDDEYVGHDQNFTYTMFGPTTMKAFFLPKNYWVGVDYNAYRGTVSGGGSGTYNYGTELELVAEPYDGYHFDGWYQDWSINSTTGVETYTQRLSIEPVLRGTVQGAINIYAKFEQDEDVNVEISENAADNTSMFADPHGKHFYVKGDRELKAWQWNPVCLPFALSEQQINKLWGYATMILRFTSAENDVLNFSYQHDMEAGVPYLVKPDHTVVMPQWEFDGDDIVIANEPVTDEDNGFQFVGIYTPHTWNTSRGDGKAEYYYGVTSNKIIKAKQTTAALKGLRAYFVLPANTTNARVNFDGIVVSIDDEVPADAIIRPTRIYNLQGQYVGSDPDGLPKGLYIINGKKQVLK